MQEQFSNFTFCLYFRIPFSGVENTYLYVSCIVWMIFIMIVSKFLYFLLCLRRVQSSFYRDGIPNLLRNFVSKLGLTKDSNNTLTAYEKFLEWAIMFRHPVTVCNCILCLWIDWSSCFRINCSVMIPLVQRNIRARMQANEGMFAEEIPPGFSIQCRTRIYANEI